MVSWLCWGGCLCYLGCVAGIPSLLWFFDFNRKLGMCRRMRRGGILSVLCYHRYYRYAASELMRGETWRFFVYSSCVIFLVNYYYILLFVLLSWLYIHSASGAVNVWSSVDLVYAMLLCLASSCVAAARGPRKSWNSTVNFDLCHLFFAVLLSFYFDHCRENWGCWRYITSYMWIWV